MLAVAFRKQSPFLLAFCYNLRADGFTPLNIWPTELEYRGLVTRFRDGCDRFTYRLPSRFPSLPLTYVRKFVSRMTTAYASLIYLNMNSHFTCVFGPFSPRIHSTVNRSAGSASLVSQEQRLSRFNYQ